jgi:hypothetical protein
MQTNELNSDTQGLSGPRDHTKKFTEHRTMETLRYTKSIESAATNNTASHTPPTTYKKSRKLNLLNPTTYESYATAINTNRYNHPPTYYHDTTSPSTSPSTLTTSQTTSPLFASQEVTHMKKMLDTIETDITTLRERMKTMNHNIQTNNTKIEREISQIETHCNHRIDNMKTDQ